MHILHARLPILCRYLRAVRCHLEKLRYASPPPGWMLRYASPPPGWIMWSMARRSTSRRWRRLERWQVLLAAVVAAAASIIVALISLDDGGTTSVGVTTTTPPPSLSVVITSEFEQSHPPPPGRLYMWNGTVRNMPTDALIFVIGKIPGAQPEVTEGESSPQWLVSPAASISRNGAWSVTWVIVKPPSSVQWIAVVQIPSSGACASPGCPSPFQPPFGLSSQGSRAPGVVATATYRPKASP